MFKYKVIIILSILFLSIAAFAHEPLWPHETVKSIPYDTSIRFGKLNNGLRYLIKKNSTPENRVSLSLDVQVGSINEKDNERGIAHFLEHMVFNGSTHFKPDELVKFFQRIGMSFGPDANAHTGFNETVYKILLPENSEKLLDEGFMVLRDFADGALLSDKEVNNERGVILSEKLARDSFSYRTQVAEIGFSYKGSNLAKRFPIGTKEVLLKINSSMLKKFYKKWYVPSNMVLVVVGDIKDINTVEILIKQKFSSMIPKYSDTSENALKNINRNKSEAFYHYEKEAGKTEISIGITRNIKPQIDGIDYRKNKLAQTIASMIINFRLQKLIENGDTSFTEAYFYTGDFLNRYQYSFISLDTNPEKWKDTLKTGRKIIKQVFKYGFSPEEFNTAKKMLLSNLKSAAESETTRKSSSIASNIIRNLNSNKVILSPTQKYDLYKKILDNLDNRKIFQILKSIWDNQYILVMVSGNLKLTSHPEETIFNEYKKLDNMKVMPFKNDKTIKFPYLKPYNKTKIVSKKTDDKLNIKTLKLSNNIIIHLKKTDFKKNKLNISVIMGYGKFNLNKNLRGLAEISENVVNDSGLGKISSSELYKALADKNVDINFNVGIDNFEIYGSADKEHLETLLQLIYHEIKDPGIRQSVYDNYIMHLKQKEDGLKHSVNGQYGLYVERFLRGNDYRFGMPSFYEQKRFNINDIKKYITENFKNSPVEVNVVGDFDEGNTVKLLTKYFGDFNKRPEFKKIQYTQSLNFPAKQNKNFNFESKIPKSLLTFNYLTTDRRNIHSSRVLGLLSELVNERLRVVIREKLGESYSPFAYNFSSELFKDYGVLKIFVYAKKEDIKNLKSYIYKMIEDLKNKDITDDEFERIKNPLITQIKDQIKTNEYWLSVLTGSTRYAEKFEWAKTILDDYKSITKDEVLTAAKKYLTSDRLSVVVIKPE